MLREIDILLIENHREHAFVFRQVVDSLGGYFSFFLTENTDEGLDYLGKVLQRKYRLPELIVISLDLPNEGALELLKFRKGSEELAGIPAVVLFDEPSADMVNKAYQHYANCCIMRPEDLSEHAKVVAKIWTYWTEIARFCVRELDDNRVPYLL